MIELIYTLFLLVLINFYLMARMRGTLTPTQRFMISLMSIFMVFLIFYTVGHIFSGYFARLTAPGFYIAFLLIMNLILPIITTELVLMGYRYFKLDQKK